MKRLFIIITALLISYTAFSQSQTEMNVSAQAKYEQADKELNQVYNEIIKRYSKSDTTFIKNLRKEQRLWVQLRDARLETFYPQDKQHRQLYGTANRMCAPLVLEDLTRKRIEELKVYLEDSEGDVCAPMIIKPQE